MFATRRILACLAVPLLAALAGAQSPPPDVQPLPVSGGVELLVTQIDPGGLSTTSVLLPPSGGAPATHGTTTSQLPGLLPTANGPQRFLTRWSEASGATHLLMTQEQPAETPDEHAARHAAALVVLLAQFPPAAPVTDSSAPTFDEGTQAFKTSWTGLDGLDHEVITIRKNGESLDKWAERHAAGVGAMLKVFPPKPVSPVACVPDVASLVA